MSTVFYIADDDNNVIRKVDSSGIISTLALTSADPLWAPASFFPSGLALDSTSSNLYVTDVGQEIVWKINLATLVVTRVAGNGGSPNTGYGGPALNAGLSDVNYVALDAAGNIYFSTGFGVIAAVNMQATTQTLLNVSVPAGYIEVVAGQLGMSGFSGDTGQATSALCQDTRGVAIDASGNLYFGDRQNERIRKVTTAGIISTVAGNNTPGFGGDGGPASGATLSVPRGVSFDSLGNLYVGDTGNCRIRVINLTGSPETIFGVSVGAGDIQTLAGTGTNSGGIVTPGYSGDGGPATSAHLGFLDGSYVDPLGNLFVCDDWNNVVRLVNSTGTISTVAGFYPGNAGYTGDGGPATSATMNTPLDVALVQSSSPPPTVTQVTLMGNFEDLRSVAISNGYLIVSLPQSTSANGQQIPASVQKVLLDNNGYIIQPFNVVPTDLMVGGIPSPPVYRVYVYSADGTKTWKSPHTMTVLSTNGGTQNINNCLNLSSD